MQIAIGIGAMLLGSWVLNSPVPEEAEETAPPTAAVQPTFMRPQPARSGASGGGMQPSQPPRGRQPMTREEIYRSAQEQRTRQQRTGQNATSDVIQPGMVRALPTVPTELAQPNTPGMPEMPQPPTAGQPAADQNASSRMPNAPTYRPPTAPAPPRSSYSSYATLEQQRQLAGTAAYRSFAPSSGPEKVYAGTQVSSSGVSPYMQLFRNDTAGGTIDNYTTLVRPQLQQQRLNQQFGVDLWGMQRENRLQQSSLLRMQENARSLQGVGTPQFYMNAGNSYPGYSNPGYGNPGYGP